jgi:hypothetical protein
MPIGATTVSFSDIRTEFGGSGAVSISDYYRGGSNIRNNAANNNSTNLAASVPTSGVIDFSDYRSTAKAFRKTYSAGATDQTASSVFGDDYSVDYPKEVVVGSGIELGTTNTSSYGLEIDSGASGTIQVTNDGTVTGAGGAIAGNGGTALRVNASNVTVINNGTLRGGGGGGGTGGTGGTGGGGSANQDTVRSGGCPSSCPPDNGQRFCSGGETVISCNAGAMCNMDDNIATVTCRTTVSTSGGAGGAGGAGAVGQGYNQGAGTGSAGSAGAAGGTNAGTGGTGGAGGDGGAFGSAGSTGATGATGANGNASNGSAGSGGSAGGSAGNALLQSVSCTFTNNGTTQGATT